MSRKSTPSSTHYSSLARQAAKPITGVGAGIPQNQALHGASDPEGAAASAVNLDSIKDMRPANDINDLKRKKCLEGYRDGLILQGENMDSVIRILSRADQSDLEKLEANLDQARKRKIDEEEERSAQTAVQGFLIQPDEPTYQYIYDADLRSRIESDLQEIDFSQMIFDGFAEQDVKIRKNLEVTFRTISTQHALWIERRLHEAARMSEQYGRHWFSLLQLAVAVQKINGRDIGADLNAFDEEDLVDRFWETMKPRIKRIHKLPTEITDLLIANMAWFSGRVRKMVVGDLTEKLGNS